MTIVGQRLRAVREKANLSQAELAGRVGTSQQTIDKIERGLTKHPRFVVEIADALNVRAAYLKGLTDDPTPEPIRSRIEAELKQVPDDRLAEILRAVREAKS
ncbi:helix-turn-helix domain-containing protein [Azospirillum sp.]|uniref:helix-turn-helix domain-containing protein n=1 Tax=Azospirillum sp. TaxID=34012 RepID=UPI003D7252D5